MNSATGLAALVENAINHYLALDPEIAARLAQLQGKVIGLTITGLNAQLFLFPDAQGVQVLSHYEGNADTVIRGGPLALARLGAGGKAVGAGVEIDGDTQTGQLFQDVLAGIEFDWEEALSHWVGDAAAHQAGNLVRETKDFADRAGRNSRLNVSEFLTEEARLLPTPFEVEEFLDQVDTLRMDADRLQARVKRLMEQSGKTH